MLATSYSAFFWSTVLAMSASCDSSHSLSRRSSTMEALYVRNTWGRGGRDSRTSCKLWRNNTAGILAVVAGKRAY